jgi:hypothetical protein
MATSSALKKANEELQQRMVKCCLFLGINPNSDLASIKDRFERFCRPPICKTSWDPLEHEHFYKLYIDEVELCGQARVIRRKLNACLTRVEEARADVPRLLRRAFLGGIARPIQPDAGSAMCEVHHFFWRYPGLQRQIGGLIARYGTS